MVSGAARRTVLAFITTILTTVAAVPTWASIADVESIKVLNMLVTPSPTGHKEWIDAINQARVSVDMVMYHLTDADVIAALKGAKDRGVNVRLILDSASMQNSRYLDFFNQIVGFGINARKSSSSFSITHEKAMIVDASTVNGAMAFVTAMNLANHQSTTRDFGVVTADRLVISEMFKVFEADWQNAQTGQGVTPDLDPHSPLIWAPVNAQEKLVELISNAKSEVISTVENLGDEDIHNAFAAAAKRGAKVRLIVPLCDLMKNPFYNLPFVTTLRGMGVDARLMPGPSTELQPYIHSKMIMVDRKVAYVGSINFSRHSILQSRELGILFADVPAITRVLTVFEADWRQSVLPPAALPTDCPVMN